MLKKLPIENTYVPLTTQEDWNRYMWFVESLGWKWGHKNGDNPTFPDYWKRHSVLMCVRTTTPLTHGVAGDFEEKDYKCVPLSDILPAWYQPGKRVRCECLADYNRVRKAAEELGLQHIQEPEEFPQLVRLYGSKGSGQPGTDLHWGNGAGFANLIILSMTEAFGEPAKKMPPLKLPVEDTVCECKSPEEWDNLLAYVKDYVASVRAGKCDVGWDPNMPCVELYAGCIQRGSVDKYKKLGRRILTFAEVVGESCDGIKVGDRVRIKRANTPQNFVGKFGTVVNVDKTAHPFTVKMDDGYKLWFQANEVELLPPEPAKEEPKPLRYKKGDRVRVCEKPVDHVLWHRSADKLCGQVVVIDMVDDQRLDGSILHYRTSGGLWMAKEWLSPVEEEQPAAPFKIGQWVTECGHAWKVTKVYVKDGAWWLNLRGQNHDYLASHFRACVPISLPRHNAAVATPTQEEFDEVYPILKAAGRSDMAWRPGLHIDLFSPYCWDASGWYARNPGYEILSVAQVMGREPIPEKKTAMGEVAERLPHIKSMVHVVTEGEDAGTKIIPVAPPAPCKVGDAVKFLMGACAGSVNQVSKVTYDRDRWTICLDGGALVYSWTLSCGEPVFKVVKELSCARCGEQHKEVECPPAVTFPPMVFAIGDLVRMTNALGGIVGVIVQVGLNKVKAKFGEYVGTFRQDELVKVTSSTIFMAPEDLPPTFELRSLPLPVVFPDYTSQTNDWSTSPTGKIYYNHVPVPVPRKESTMTPMFQSLKFLAVFPKLASGAFKLTLAAFMIYIMGFLISWGSAQMEVAHEASTWHTRAIERVTVPVYAFAADASDEVAETVPAVMPWVWSTLLFIAAGFLGVGIKKARGILRGDHLPIRPDIQKIIDSLVKGEGWILDGEKVTGYSLIASPISGNLWLKEGEGKLLPLNTKEEAEIVTAASALFAKLILKRDADLVAKGGAQIPMAAPMFALPTDAGHLRQLISEMQAMLAKREAK
jgi:hypothetical protein